MNTPIDGKKSQKTSNTDEFLEKHVPGISAEVIALRQRILRLNSARNRDLVRVILLVGEPGSGKNHLSKIIAAHSRWLELRAAGDDSGVDVDLNVYLDRFTEIHMPALPESLIESELFGYKRGAFTGANQPKPGLLDGNNDYILLDEIGDIPALLQAKLLRVVEDGRFMPLGGKTGDERTTSAKFIMATNIDLQDKVYRKEFREDLYWRLRDQVIRVAPLRNQPENIPAIIERILESLQEGRPVDLEDRGQLQMPTKREIDWATAQSWPGNVRELRHALARWLFEEGDRDLPEVVQLIADETAPLTSSLSPNVGEIVHTRLNAALDGTSSYRLLNDILQEFTGEIRSAIVTWYDKVAPNDETLTKMFPGHSTTDSVRNKISEWRTALRQSKKA